MKYQLPKGDRGKQVEAIHKALNKDKTPRLIEHVTGNLFFQNDRLSCGLCAINSILSMHGKKPDVVFNTRDGTEPDKIIAELENRGVSATAKNTTFNKLKPKSVIYYPKPEDHYVTLEAVKGETVLVNDSTKKKPQLFSRKELESKWLKEGKGYVIETK